MPRIFRVLAIVVGALIGAYLGLALALVCWPADIFAHGPPAPWYAAIAAACHVAAFLCGLVMSSPTEWLVLSLGTFALVGAPRAAMWREAHE